MIDRSLEERAENAVISELGRQPLHALELVTALRGRREVVVAAVERLEAGGLIQVPSPGARFELV
jgi:hypothetical protein